MGRGKYPPDFVEHGKIIDLLSSLDHQLSQLSLCSDKGLPVVGDNSSWPPMVRHETSYGLKQGLSQQAFHNFQMDGSHGCACKEGTPRFNRLVPSLL